MTTETPERIPSMRGVSARYSSPKVFPTIVYLDLNKWIDLARAEAGSAHGEKYQLALRTAEQLVSAGEAIFPLSSAHFMEVAKIGDASRRRKLAKLMVKLSNGWLLVSARLSSNVCIEAGGSTSVPTAVPRRGDRSSLAEPLKLAFIDLGQLANANLDNSVLRSPAILEELLATARANREFVDRWKSFALKHEAGRALRWGVPRNIRKRAYCAAVAVGVLDRLAIVLNEFGLAMDDLEALGPDRCVELLERVPFLDVEINLHVERNEHRDRKIAPNDEIDLGFLSLAVPYCQVVVTEKFWAALIHRTKLDIKYGTSVGHDVNEALMSLRAK